MFLYPALLAGFLFVAVPLLVHLINMLRHRRQPWAAMDFLLASYRKQKKWIRLRQLLLLLSRIAVAALLIAMLCGWTGGGRLLNALGGQTTHHVVILDDSYSMGDVSGGSTPYARSLQSLEALTKRLASDESGSHQLTVMRASRASMLVKGGSDSGDAAADLSAQTITSDGRLVGRLMSTKASSIRTDLIPALDLATELISSTPADKKYLYIASDFRQRDWGSPERLAESLRKIPEEDVDVRMIDCAIDSSNNLGITEVYPSDDLWVAGVPVVVNVTVHNYGNESVENISLANRVIRYPESLQLTDPTLQFSGQIESLAPVVIESIEAGGEVTKTFQVFVSEIGTHAIEVKLPDDALPIDNVRSCTLPLSDIGKVLVIDADPNQLGAYHIGSVLNPGSQVRTGALPDIQPPSFLRSATIETLAPYRAIFLIDLPEVGENAADALSTFVNRGGGIAWFLGSQVRAKPYNDSLLAQNRQLLPRPLDKVVDLPDGDRKSGDIVFGQRDTLIEPLRSGGDAAWSLVGLAQSWTLAEPQDDELDPESNPGDAKDVALDAPRVLSVLKRRDGKDFVTQHQVGKGRIVTVLAGFDGDWTNWRSDLTFVPFLLLTNATLWSGAAPETNRPIDQPLVQLLPEDQYAMEVTFMPAAKEPPRVPIEMKGDVPESDKGKQGASPVPMVSLNPTEMIINGEESVDEVLRPGISEWALTRTDGKGQVVPVSSVIRIGEGDLNRANTAEITQSLLPLEVKFVSSTEWTAENQTTGSSTLTLFLLGLLGLMLAAEQLLAYWASYHVAQPTAGKAA